MLRGFCNETNLSITSTQGNLRLMSSSSNGLSELSSVFTTVWRQAKTFRIVSRADSHASAVSVSQYSM